MSLVVGVTELRTSSGIGLVPLLSYTGLVHVAGKSSAISNFWTTADLGRALIREFRSEVEVGGR